jgi:protein-disulfide isomerase
MLKLGQQQRKRKLNKIIIIIKYIPFALLLLFLIMTISYGSYSSGQGMKNKYDKYIYAATSTEEPQQQLNNLSLSNLIQKGSPYLGNPSTAPITIIDFSDFQCYLCARYVKATEPLIKEAYIQTGKVVLIFKHLPNRGSDSMGASVAAQCTNDQGKFWDFHKLLYENQKPIDSGWVSKDNLKKLAAKIPELDINKFNLCFEGQKYESFVEQDVALAASLFGFHDTPSFVIVNSKDGSNPEILKGAHPFPSFKAIIDKKLAEVEKK